MVTLTGKNKTIQFELTEDIHECSNNMFILDMPTIVCDNRKDAECIQNQLNAFVGEISRKLIKE